MMSSGLSFDIFRRWSGSGEAYGAASKAQQAAERAAKAGVDDDA